MTVAAVSQIAIVEHFLAPPHADTRQTLAEWITTAHANGWSSARMAEAIAVLTDGIVTPSRQTVQRWAEEVTPDTTST